MRGWEPGSPQLGDNVTLDCFVVHQSHRVVSGLLSTPLLPLPSHLSKGDLEIALRLQMGGVPLQGGLLSTEIALTPDFLQGLLQLQHVCWPESRSGRACSKECRGQGSSA